MSHCRSGGIHEQVPPAPLESPRADPLSGIEGMGYRWCAMMLLVALGFVCLAVLINLLIYPVRSALVLARLFCGIFGIFQLLAAWVSFQHGADLEVVGLLVGAMFLFWCAHKLTHPETA